MKIRNWSLKILTWRDMQFKVPQNIDLEDRIVGPLTLVQLIYVVVGGLIIYILFQSLTAHIGIFLVLAIPIGAVTLGLAFLKIQDQPLSHFIRAGLYYLNHPKIRRWLRQGQIASIIHDAPVKTPQKTAPIKKKIAKSDLEKLAYMLDTQPMARAEEKHFGQITAGFEKILKQGGISGSMEPSQNSKR